jgi:hypothetical protein
LDVDLERLADGRFDSTGLFGTTAWTLT